MSITESVKAPANLVDAEFEDFSRSVDVISCTKYHGTFYFLISNPHRNRSDPDPVRVEHYPNEKPEKAWDCEIHKHPCSGTSCCFHVGVALHYLAVNQIKIGCLRRFD